jgi:hypothetical protein
MGSPGLRFERSHEPVQELACTIERSHVTAELAVGDVMYTSVERRAQPSATLEGIDTEARCA